MPEAGEVGHADHEEDIDSDSAPRVNPLQLLGFLRTVKDTSQPLLYMYLTLNDREIDVMMYTGATHYFICHNIAAS